MKNQKEVLPPFCPSRQGIPKGYCKRPQTCKDCQNKNVDITTDPRPDCVKYDKTKPPKLEFMDKADAINKPIDTTDTTHSTQKINSYTNFQEDSSNISKRELKKCVASVEVKCGFCKNFRKLEFMDKADAINKLREICPEYGTTARKKPIFSWQKQAPVIPQLEEETRPEKEFAEDQYSQEDEYVKEEF